MNERPELTKPVWRFRPGRFHWKFDYALVNQMRPRAKECFICAQPFDRHVRSHIDHDHVDESIRGFLCGQCNLGLGAFKDNAMLLIRAANYLTADDIAFVRLERVARASATTDEDEREVAA